ncbi:MAG: hypothetical protein ACYCT0_11335, partial [Sulfobacillus sp.]
LMHKEDHGESNGALYRPVNGRALTLVGECASHIEKFLCDPMPQNVGWPSRRSAGSTIRGWLFLARRLYPLMA